MSESPAPEPRDDVAVARRGRLPDLCTAAALTAGLVWLWVYRLGAPGASYVTGVGDVFGYFLPAYAYEAERLAAGSFPFWNPYQGAGVPFLGVLQPGALYPVRFMLLWLSPVAAMGWWTFGHVLLSLLGMYALCRRLGTSGFAAAIAAIVFTTGFALPWIHATPLLEPGSWLPLLALAVLAILRDGGWGWVLVLGAGTAMPPLAGGYQATLYMIYALALFALAVVLDGRRHGRALRLRHVAQIAVAAVLAIATAAPQVLPTLAWSAETMRQAKPLSDMQMMPLFIQAAQWDRIIRFFVRQTSADTCYFSVPVALLALVGCMAARPMGTVFALAALVIGIFTTVGPESVFFRVYKAVPGFAMFRFPSRLLLLVAFFTGLAAALGLEAIVARGPLAPPSRRLVVRAAALLVVVALLVWPYRNTLAVIWTAGPELTEPDPRFVPRPTRPPSSYRAWVPGGRMDLGAGKFVRQGMRLHVRVLQDYDPLSSARLGTFLTAVTGMPPPDPDDLHLFTGALLSDPFITRPELLDLVSVRAIMIRPDGVRHAGVSGWTHEGQGDNLLRFRNDRALPRAYVVQRARFVADQQASLDTIIEDGFDGHGEVVLVGSPETESERAVVAGTPVPAVPARFVRDDPEDIVASIAPAAPSVLVVADAFAPGWEATVDGKPRRLWQANYMVRGVVVGPEDRTVELRYHAPGFAAGLTICIATWTMVLLALAVARRGRRPAANP
jgi:hypothetical protein